MSVRLVDDKPLFRKGNLRDYLDRQREKLREAIRDIPRDRILQTPLSSLVDEVHKQCRIDVPTIPEDDRLADRVQRSRVTDTNVDVSGERSLDIRDRSTPTYVDGSQITFTLVFAGEYELLQYRPRKYSNNPPRASAVKSNALKFTYKWPQNSGSVEAANARFRNAVGQVRRRLCVVEEHVEDEYNESLQQTVEHQLKRRKESVLEDRNAAESLPYELKRRQNSPKTYAAPVERTSTDPKPEERHSGRVSNWVIEDEIYEDILTVMKNMAWVMERSPSAFEEMKEVDLRVHFLVQLNGQFTGPGTGETFNTTGKTDIYLPVKDRAVFIAECKFWDGPKKFQEAVDQLLGYSSWRDTKTALVVFNRNRDTARVLDQIPEVVEEREDYIRTVDYGEETDFRFVLHHGDDPGREVTVTVMVFDVPTS